MTNHLSAHWIIIPIYGPFKSLAIDKKQFIDAGFSIVFVDNNKEPDSGISALAEASGCFVIWNGNRGGIAGGFNRGIMYALSAGAKFITLLDQDSLIETDSLFNLRQTLIRFSDERLIVGPRIWDQRRGRWHQASRCQWREYFQTRLLISSGTTFATRDWPVLGPFHEGLFIDFVDHTWCFQAQASGFTLIQVPGTSLWQQFGVEHPNLFCRFLGLELYSPNRHFFGLRNLRWLLLQNYVPLDLRCKELVKMIFKPCLWLLFEPCRKDNLKAILSALIAPLPSDRFHV